MRRVGWIRIGALGDLLVGLASLRDTIDTWTESASETKFSVIGSRLWLEIIEAGHWPEIDRIVVVEKRGTLAEIYDRVGREWKRRETQSVPLRVEFSDGYEAVINTRVDSPRQGFPAFWAGVPERWGSAAGLASLIYNHRAPHAGKDPLIHERDVPLLMVDEASAHKHTGTLSERIARSKRIKRWREVGLPCPRALDRGRFQTRFGRYFLINPTSSRREKAWPSEHFARLVEEIGRLTAGRLNPVVIGAPSETEWLQEVAGAGTSVAVLQPTTIGELFDAVAGARFLVANTSSTQFVAASCGVRALTLIGRAKPEIWGPVGPRDRFVRGTEPHGVESMFERERLAYEAIAPEAVASVLKQEFAAELRS